jgi:hypothetical protein
MLFATGLRRGRRLCFRPGLGFVVVTMLNGSIQTSRFAHFERGSDIVDLHCAKFIPESS